MRTDAEKNGAVWAMKSDPRVTKVGKIIRKTRIDELPQLWNVLKGEMSLIGPRPERPEFVKELEKEIRLLKKENDFLEEASAFFAASRLKSAKTKE